MEQDEKRAWYEAFKFKDSRFDGRFFVGVSSTGVYCRPVCRAKLPKAENCSFYRTAAEAEQAGYRPCLLCRPELAPGEAPVDATASLARRAARLLEESCGSGRNIEEYVGRLGCTDRHLRRAFAVEYKVSPVQYLQTCRLLLAKNLLTDTRLSVLDVALSAGFGSLRRFNDLFKKHYRLSPGALRKQAAGDQKPEADLALSLSYRPPYQWEKMLNFLALRAIPGVEAVRGGEYFRTVHLPAGKGRSVSGWVRVGHKPQSRSLSLSLDASLLPVLQSLLARIRHLFDLYCDPEAIGGVLSAMNQISPGLYLPGARLPGCFDAFEMAVRAVLGQQITVKAAGTLAARLVNAFGRPLDGAAAEGLNRTFPTPEDIIALDGPIDSHLGPLGITKVRARTILELARALVSGRIDLSLSAQPEVEIKKLMDIPGIGDWTAQYIAMRAMAWPDAFLPADCGVKKALAPRTPKEISVLAEAWRPWRAYAVINLWNSV